MRRPWSIVEKMAKMRIALFGSDLGPLHAKAAIGFFGHVQFLDWLGETGPAAAAIELVERTEKGFARDDVDIDSGAMLIPIGIMESRLGAAHLRDAILLGRQFLPQFVVGYFRRLFRAW